jgi:hypothetical protein
MPEKYQIPDQHNESGITRWICRCRWPWRPGNPAHPGHSVWSHPGTAGMRSTRNSPAHTRTDAQGLDQRREIFRVLARRRRGARAWGAMLTFSADSIPAGGLHRDGSEFGRKEAKRRAMWGRSETIERGGGGRCSAVWGNGVWGRAALIPRCSRQIFSFTDAWPSTSSPLHL